MTQITATKDRELLRDSKFLTISAWIAVSFVFIGLFAKDIIAAYIFEYEQRNIFGAAFLLLGGMFALFVLFGKHGIGIVTRTLTPVLGSWVVLLFFIAPVTAYVYNGAVLISPHAVGFAAAIICFLVSPAILKKVLLVTLGVQFAALLFEYHNGVSITLTANETAGIYFKDYSWLIDPDIGLIRAKGLLDSTHDSTWLFLYSAFAFGLDVVAIVFLCLAAWMAQGRLGILAAGALIFAGIRPLRTIGILAAVGLAAVAVYPDKMSGGVAFFLEAFNPNSSSNTYRLQATRQALDHMLGWDTETPPSGNDAPISPPSSPGETEGNVPSDMNPPIDAENGSVSHDITESVTGAEGEEIQQSTQPALTWLLRTIFGASGSALGAGKVTSEMDYTLLVIEYGLVGLALVAWTVGSVFLDGVRSRHVANIAFGLLMPLLMFSSSLQSASSFFAFWVAVLFMSRTIRPPIAQG